MSENLWIIVDKRDDPEFKNIGANFIAFPCSDDILDSVLPMFEDDKHMIVKATEWKGKQ